MAKITPSGKRSGDRFAALAGRVCGAGSLPATLEPGAAPSRLGRFLLWPISKALGCVYHQPPESTAHGHRRGQIQRLCGGR